MTLKQGKADKFDQLRSRAVDLIRHQKKDAPQTSASMLDLIHELTIHQAELEIQNEELKRAQQELTDLYQQFENLYEFAPCGYLNLNPKGLITRINLAGVTLLNGFRASVLHSGFSQYVAQGWQDGYVAALQKAGQTGEKQSLELQLVTTNKEYCWVWAEIQADQTKADVVLQWRMTLVDISSMKAIESTLLASEKKYRQLFEDMVGGGALMEIADRDPQGRIMDLRILEVNSAFERLTGIGRDQAVNASIRQLWPQTEAFWFEHFDRVLRDSQPIQLEGLHRELDKYFLVSAFRLAANCVGVTFIDISAHKKIEEVLENARQDLEKQVEVRTVELRRSNRKLVKEIESRKQVQESLVLKTQELKDHSTELEETNITLKVLLKEREYERRRLEEKVVCNVNELTLPYLTKLAAGNLSKRQRTLLDAVSRSLKDIVSPMSRRFIIENNQLTPVEGQVANLIRQGISTKDIADILGVASSTVDFHRLNIRRKLKLTHKRINLQSYLRSLL